MCTACGHRMAHRKWKEIKQQPRLLPGPAVPGCSLISFHFLRAILCLQAVVNFSRTEPWIMYPKPGVIHICFWNPGSLAIPIFTGPLRFLDSNALMWIGFVCYSFQTGYISDNSKYCKDRDSKLIKHLHSNSCRTRMSIRCCKAIPDVRPIFDVIESSMSP